MTLGDVIANNPDSYPYNMNEEGFYLSQQYYLAWYYGSNAHERLDKDVLSHHSYLVWKLDGMRKDGVNISSITVSDMDEMSFENASFWFKVDSAALTAFAVYNAISIGKSQAQAKNVFKVNSKADAMNAIDDLPDEIASNVKRFVKKSSGRFSEYSLDMLDDGSYQIKMVKPGDYSGYAEYYKVIDSQGTTINVYKDTFDNAGSLIHRKGK